MRVHDAVGETDESHIGNAEGGEKLQETSQLREHQEFTGVRRLGRNIRPEAGTVLDRKGEEKERDLIAGISQGPVEFHAHVSKQLGRQMLRRTPTKRSLVEAGDGV